MYFFALCLFEHGGRDIDPIELAGQMANLATNQPGAAADIQNVQIGTGHMLLQSLGYQCSVQNTNFPGPRTARAHHTDLAIGLGVSVPERLPDPERAKSILTPRASSGS